MRLDTELLARVDSVCGPRGRTGFVERALEAALSEAKGSVWPEQAGPVDPVRSSERVRPAAPPRVPRAPVGIPGVKTARELALERQAQLNKARKS